MPGRAKATQGDVDKVRAGLEALRKLDLKSVAISEVFAQLSQLSSGYATTTVTVNTARLYRCRRNKDRGRFVRLGQIMAPTASEVTKLGRVNDIGQSIFYCSPDRRVSVQEMRPAIGEIMTLLMLEGRNPSGRFELMHAGVDEVGRRRREPGKWISFGQPLVGDKHQDAANTLIKRYHTEEFLKHVRPGEEHLYKASIAIAHGMFKFERAAGIVYPSFALDFKGVNYAIKPDRVLEYFQPKYALELRVEWQAASGEFAVKPLALASNFNTKGEILWSRDSPTPEDVWPILGSKPVARPS